MKTMARGFVAPVHDAQASFRKIMHALATPGRIMTLMTDLDAPEPVNVAAAATLLALCDFETTLWLSPALAAQGTIGEYLGFHTGTRLTADAASASFALIDLTRDQLDIAGFARGTPEYPDRSTTVVMLCESLAGPDAISFTGPGIAGRTKLGFSPMPADFRQQWDGNRETFPLGIDLILTCGNELMALPRSARPLREAV
jgi:alpha-D-ribose 1-methylphosphonate 5-triphosphate synthase subunit PhnH